MRFELRELTAAAPGGVSVLELRGSDTLSRLEALVPGPLAPGAPRLVRLVGAEGELLDEALLWIATPERAELHVHGSPPLVRLLVRELGIELASPSDRGGQGLEARAEIALARAPGDTAARLLLDQVEGALRSALEELRRGTPEQAHERIRKLIRAGELARPLLDPPRVVLAGPPNAGKSTLFNLLLGRERAVVDDELGTTRDALEERVAFGPWMVLLFDTAGLRDLESGPVSGAREVERAGQELTRRLMAAADLVLWLEPDPGREAPSIGVPLQRWTPRADELGSQPISAHLRPVSVRRDSAAARRAVVTDVCAALGLVGEAWSPGAAVPFDEVSRRGVADLASSSDPSGFERCLDSLLGG